MAGSVEHQREVTRLLLSVIDDIGFALAGSGAIREHGVTTRPTEDVDLFTTNIGAQRFDQAIELAVATLDGHGYRVVEVRRAELYARLHVTVPDGHDLEVDFGIDWRASEPVRLDVGPVLALPDAVANKVGALYGRAEVRDYLDVDAIRQSAAYTDEELLDLAAEHDPSFEPQMFASLLARVRELTDADVVEYETKVAARVSGAICETVRPSTVRLGLCLRESSLPPRTSSWAWSRCGDCRRHTSSSGQYGIRLDISGPFLTRSCTPNQSAWWRWDCWRSTPKPQGVAASGTRSRNPEWKHCGSGSPSRRTSRCRCEILPR